MFASPEGDGYVIILHVTPPTPPSHLANQPLMSLLPYKDDNAAATFCAL